MQIIKQGINLADRVYRATCDNCGTVFEFQRKEAAYISAPYNGKGALVSIECPTATCKRICDQKADDYLKTDAEDHVEGDNAET
jgi:hypothetical protein